MFNRNHNYHNISNFLLIFLLMLIELRIQKTKIRSHNNLLEFDMNVRSDGLGQKKMNSSYG